MDRPSRDSLLLVTRPEPGARRSVEFLRGAGYDALATPATRLAALDPVQYPAVPGAANASSFDALLVTSANGARFLSRRAEDGEAVAHQLLGLVREGELPFYCVGEKTAEACLDSFGREADGVAAEQSQEGLFELLRERRFVRKGGRFLMPCAAGARVFLHERLAEAGAELVTAPLYESILDEEGLSILKARLEEAAATGRKVWLLFYAGSQVEAVFDRLGKTVAESGSFVRLAAIGQATARTIAERIGGRAHAVAPDASDAGMLEAIRAAQD